MMEFVVEAPGAALAVRESRQDGKPLLMLHGGPGEPGSMLATVAPLLSEMRCISFDQRGVGRSTCTDGRYDVAAYLADIEAIQRTSIPGHVERAALSSQMEV
jgi:pimeloyl-ACP methyl ester carboxylesterase